MKTRRWSAGHPAPMLGGGVGVRGEILPRRTVFETDAAIPGKDFMDF